MLHAKKNRLDYGALLAPPEGYTLEQAYATTYSLDLLTLLTVPLALFYSSDLNLEKPDVTRFDLLNAIEKTDKRVRVYCQKGKIKSPLKYHRLFTYLEDAVVEVTPKSVQNAFHPKVWIIRFARKKDIFYRVAVLSRNLTFDRSWDIALFTEGLKGKNTVETNKPLVTFLKPIIKNNPLPDSKKFLSDLAKVNFDGIDGFDKLFFHPLDEGKSKNPISEKLQYKKLLIISPFISDGQLKKFNGISKQTYLFSRAEELDKLNATTIKEEGIKFYAFNKILADEESYGETEGNLSENTDTNLHAKMYIGETEEGDYIWYSGSANCSHNAFNSNQEFLAEMRTSEKTKSPDAMIKLLTAREEENEAGLFADYLPVTQVEQNGISKVEEEIRSLEFALTQLTISARAAYEELTAPCELKLNINTKRISTKNKDIKVYISLPHAPTIKEELILDEAQDLVFKNISIKDLSVFLRVEIQAPLVPSRNFLLKIEIDNLPENRKQIIFRSLIDSQEKFMQLLHFLLADEDTNISPFLEDASNKSSKIDGKQAAFLNLPLYEPLLRAASRSPHKLQEIDSFLKRISTEDAKNPDAQPLIPQEFTEIWNVFKLFSNVK